MHRLTSGPQSVTHSPLGWVLGQAGGSTSTRPGAPSALTVTSSNPCPPHHFNQVKQCRTQQAAHVQSWFDYVVLALLDVQFTRPQWRQAEPLVVGHYKFTLIFFFFFLQFYFIEMVQNCYLCGTCYTDENVDIS